jgi:hypothetical protein
MSAYPSQPTDQNGGAEMVILIWIFTGIWPYTKLLMSLVVWIAPPTCIGVKRRGVILLWIDALAKLSVVDIFTMLLGVAILLVFIGGPDESITSDGVYYALKAIVVPKAGCYCFLIAQRLSRVSSRFLLEYHESVVSCATRKRAEQEGDMSVSQVHLGPDSPNTPDRELEAQPSSNYLSDTISDRVTDDPQPISCGEQSSDLSLPQESLAQTTHFSTTSSSFVTLKDFRWGYWGVVFGFTAIVLIFAIGCIFAPAIAFDLSTIGGLAIESEKTFEEAVSDYGVFVVVSGILVRANFVLSNKIDYVGLGLLLSAVGISASLLFMIQAYHFVKRKLHERRRRRENSEGPTYGHDGCGLPFYFRLFMWNHMEIYVISFAIGVWQLGSITSYSIYLYCDLLTRIYDVLTFLGIAEASTTQCFKEQSSNGGNLIIIILSFFILSIAFYFETRAQYKRNIQDCMKDIDERDVPRFSLIWSSDMSKNSLYSHLTESLSIGNTESFRGLSMSPSSPGLSRVSDANSVGCDQPPSLDAVRNDHEDDGIPSQVSSDEHRTNNPVATPRPVASSSSRHSDNSSVIDTSCDLTITPSPLVVQPFMESLEETDDPEGRDAPPVLPSCSMEDDPPEVPSLDTPTPTQTSRSRLSFLRDLFSTSPRRWLSPPTTMTTSNDRIDSSDDTIVEAPLPIPRHL